MILDETKWDPSLYRYGDELNMSSPYYEDLPEDRDITELVSLENWEVWDKENLSLGFGTVLIKVFITIAYSGTRMHPETSYHLNDVLLLSFDFKGHTYSLNDMHGEFSEESYDQDFIEDAVYKKLKKTSATYKFLCYNSSS